MKNKSREMCHYERLYKAIGMIESNVKDFIFDSSKDEMLRKIKDTSPNERHLIEHTIDISTRNQGYFNNGYGN